MKVFNYSKYCDGARLILDLEASGFLAYPDPAAKIYYVRCDQIPPSGWDTSLWEYDEVTDQEQLTIDYVVSQHVPIPVPPDPTEVTLHDVPLDSAGKLYTRAESRPLDCTTYFSSAGDTIDPVGIGNGARIGWDASDPSGWYTDAVPSGYKRFSVTWQYCDSVWIKEGCVYYMNALKGSTADMEVICPNGLYFMYLGQVYQNTTGNDLTVDHYLMRHPIQGDVPMGDELNTETCSQELPSYLKYKFYVTVPESDTSSYGYMEIELYRRRTVVLDV